MNSFCCIKQIYYILIADNNTLLLAKRKESLCWLVGWYMNFTTCLIYIQSPYHFIFPNFNNRTWWNCMCSVKTKKRKDRNYNQSFKMWSSKLLVSFWARHVKTCVKKGDAGMHWTAGQLMGCTHCPCSDFFFSAI